MKILVIDDSPIHQQSARQTLVGHDLTVVGTYNEGENLVQSKHDFEVVLCDLLMPASKRAQGPRGQQFVGQEMPVGIFLALLAAKNGARYVAVFTDSDHHSHPASACFDAFNPRTYAPAPFTVEGAKVILTNMCWLDVAEEMKDGQHIYAKNWGKVLEALTSSSPVE